MASRPAGGAWVVYAPGARHATKCWPEARWVGLDQRLAALGVRRVALTTPSERRALPALDARLAASGGAWLTESVERAAALVSLSSLAVTHDSGLMHVAAASGRPVVALFGSTAPVLGFAPVGEGHAVLGRDLPCRPCTLHGRERCPLGTLACLTGIEVAEVEAAVRERLSPR
jgi:ADP-heptose:LPS heptosyltransferase